MDNLLILRINIPILRELDANYEIKLVNKAVKSYFQKKRYLNTVVGKKSEVVVRSKDGEESENVFLPLSVEIDTNHELLLQDDFALLSDESPADSSSDSSSSSSEEEIDVEMASTS